MTFRIKNNQSGTKLTPSYSSQRSYYGKANVREENGKQILKSYTTDVAEIENGRARVFGLYSNTTTRHIKDFLKQNGFKAENSKQIMQDYGGDKSYAEPTPKIEMKSTISQVGNFTIFRVDDKTEIKAVSEKTRNGFRHRAILIVNGNQVDSATAHYLNRTWESYEYQSVIDNLIDKSSYISQDKKEGLKKKFEEASHQKIQGEFNTIGNIAKLGEVFGQTEKEKNAWKERMLKAGLGNRGLDFPEDWDKLSEKEKKKRLDKTIELMKEKK